METILKAYIYEAIEVEKAGLEVNFKKNTEFIIPEEFQNKFDEIPALKTAFDHWHRDGKEHTIFIFLHPNNPKLGSQGLKNVSANSQWKGIKWLVNSMRK